MKFECKVRSRQNPGEVENILIESSDTEDALARLQRDGYFVVSIKEKAGSQSLENQIQSLGLQVKGYSKLNRVLAFGKAASTRELIFFAVQLATLLKAGVALLRALQILERGTVNVRFQAAIKAMAVTISEGRTLADALAQQSQLFPWMWKSLVEVGEMSGTLPQVLEEIARYQEASERIKGKVISAMFYPAILLLVAGGAVTFLLIKIVPKFKEIFEAQGMTLPPLTQLVVFVSDVIRHQFVFVVAIITAVVFFVRYLLKTKNGRFVLHRAFLNMPVFGEMIMQVVVVRFSRGMSTLIKAGIPLLKGLETSAALAGNAYVEARLLEVHQSVSQGHGLGAMLEAKKVFPVFMTQLVTVGEETGEVESFFTLLSDYYEEMVNQFLARITVIIEPVMLVFMAGIIGVIVIAMFMPIIELSTGAGM